jgi:SulP family sulfate permease
MIGQSVINVNSGGRGRLSTFTAGVVLLFLIVILGDWVAKIPTGALIAVMITVSIGTFDWRSLKQLRVMPLTETIVMLGTVLTVVLTHDLSLGVLVGVLLSAIFFARSAEKQLSIEKGETADGARRYRVEGELFFVSVEQFMSSIDLSEGRDEVELDFSQAHVWDASAVWAIDRVILKLRAAGVSVTTSGLNDQSAAILKRLSTYNEPQAILPAAH